MLACRISSSERPTSRRRSTSPASTVSGESVRVRAYRASARRNAAGMGDLRGEYGYRGLPYTVVLGTDHRVVRSLYGFGTSIEPLRNAVEEVLPNPVNQP